MKKQSKFYFEANISDHVKWEWICKEEGSYEDAGEPEDHAHAILNRSPKGKVRCATKREAEVIMKSAGQNGSGVWDDVKRIFITLLNDT